MAPSRLVRLTLIGWFTLVGTACADRPPPETADAAVEAPIDVEVTTPTSDTPRRDAASTWQIPEHPELVRLFAGLEICSRAESFSLHRGFSSHGYSVFVPSMDAQTIVTTVRKSAAEVGVDGPLTDGPPGPAKEDSGAMLFVDFPFVQVVLGLRSSALEAGVTRARELEFASARALGELVSDSGHIQIVILPHGRTLSATLSFPVARRPELERWIAEHTSASRRADQRTLTEANDKAFLWFGESDGRFELSVTEAIGQGPVGHACKRRAPARPPPPVDDQELDLLRQMMGK